MIDSINHILGFCGEGHPNIFTIILISLLVAKGTLKEKRIK